MADDGDDVIRGSVRFTEADVREGLAELKPLAPIVGRCAPGGCSRPGVWPRPRPPTASTVTGSRSSVRGAAATAYRVLHGFHAGSSTFLLYAGRGLATMVPKRAFSPGDLPRVEALLARNVRRMGELRFRG